MDKVIEYTNVAGEQRIFVSNGKRRAKRTCKTEKKFICQCGHEICLRCIKATWETKYDGGERVRCCVCGLENSLRYLVTAVALPKDEPQQQQDLFRSK
jgi:hypothetical protein